MSNLLIKIVYHINCYDMQPILSLYCSWLVFLLVSPTILCPVYAQYSHCCVFKLLSYCFFCFQLACLQVAALIHYQFVCNTIRSGHCGAEKLDYFLQSS